MSLLRAHAEEYTDALAQSLGGLVRLAELGPEIGVADALGLTAGEWAERKLAGKLKLEAAERRPVVAELTERGMSKPEIAEALGISEATVARDRAAISSDTPEDGAKPPTEPNPESQAVSSDTSYPEDDEGDFIEDAEVVEPEKPSAPTRGQLANQAGASDAWSTPRPFFDVLDKEFRFELDVCALPSSAKCERYFTPEDDGLAQEWTGVCWMNPPYGDEIVNWVAKAYESAQAGATVVCLVPARVDTGWWWDYCRHGEIRFVRGRLKFGGGQNSAPFPSAVVVFGRGPRVVWWEWK